MFLVIIVGLICYKEQLDEEATAWIALLSLSTYFIIDSIHNGLLDRDWRSESPPTWPWCQVRAEIRSATNARTPG